MKIKFALFLSLPILVFSMMGLSGASTGTSTIIIRPSHVYLQSDTAQGAFLISLSGYSTDSVRYRLFRSSSQYACWDNNSRTFITSASYSAGPLALGNPSGESAFWILYQRGSNKSDTVSYRDRIGPSYSANNNTIALPSAIAIKDSFIISGKLTGVSGNDLKEKYVVLAWNGNILVSASSSYIGSGEFSVYLPVGVNIDKIEVRTLENQTLASRTGIWNTFERLSDIEIDDTQTIELVLSGILINGRAMNEFNPATNNYSIGLPYGTTAIPFIEALTGFPGAILNISQASDLSGDETARSANIVLTTHDGIRTNTYSLLFTVASSSADANISELFIDAEPLEGFNPDTLHYSIILPWGTNEIPLVSCITSDSDASVQIEEAINLFGSEPERTTKITVWAAGGILSKTYSIEFMINIPAIDASITDLSIDGETIIGFNRDSLAYEVVLPFGTLDAPLVTCITADLKATVSITDASGLTGNETERTTTVVITAEDGVHTRTYSIVFSIYTPSGNAFLSGIFVDFEPLSDFNANTSNYIVNLSSGVTAVPLVTCTTSDSYANVAIYEATNLNGTTIEKTTTIVVTAEDGITEKTYSVLFEVYVPSAISSLEMLLIDGENVTGFSKANYLYAVLLPLGTLNPPAVSYDLSNLNATAVVTNASNLNGSRTERTTSIIVTAENGIAQETYSIVFKLYAPSGDASISKLFAAGNPVAGFSPGNTFYAVKLPSGTIEVPELGFELSNEKSTAVVKNAVNLNGGRTERTSTIEVSAENGISKKKYSVTFLVNTKVDDASLSMISVDGNPINGFTPGNYSYAVILPAGTTDIPEVSYTVLNETANAMVTNAINLNGSLSERTAKVVVTAENGTTIKTYSVVFKVYVPSANASLTSISVDGKAISGFSSGNLTYAVLLPFDASAVPEISYTTASEKAISSVTNASNLNGSESERTSIINVTAEDGTSKLSYKIIFMLDDDTSILNTSEPGISIYPIPASNEVIVSGLSGLSELMIIDITGDVLRVIELFENEVVIDISELQSGVYFVKTESQAFKFIKE